MTAMPGDRIVAFYDTAVCDGKAQHEVHLWTDGIVAYAEAEGTTGRLGCPWVSRDTTQIEVRCDVPLCIGHARFDLTDECWTTDRQTVAYLDAHGERIER